MTTLNNDYVTRTELKEEFREFRKEIKEDMQHHTDQILLQMDVVLERYSDQTKLLAEQHQDTQRGLKDTQKELKGTQRELKETQRKLEEVDQRLSKKLDMVIETVADIKVDITKINDKLDAKVDRVEFEQRLRPFEARL